MMSSAWRTTVPLPSSGRGPWLSAGPGTGEGLSLGVCDLRTVEVSAAAPLSGMELRRADLLSTETARHRFLAGRIAARMMLAHMLAVEPQHVVASFHCARCGEGTPVDHGRPGYLVQGQRLASGLSLARCGDWLVFLASDHAEDVGVDVEDPARPAFADAGLEQVFASAEERHELARASAKERPRLRAGLWVRKEAALKAIGAGLRIAPSAVDVRGDSWRAESNISGLAPRGREVSLDTVAPGLLGLPSGYLVSTARTPRLVRSLPGTP